MDTLVAARAQMELSLGFHMVFAAMGIGMPLLLVLAEGLHLRTGRAEYGELARRWTRVVALLFAVGAVSGTALSFELGLLWPRLMAFAGSVLGPAFALEGYAFFIEAIFIGLYLYGWDRLTPRQHWLVGLPVALSGAASGALVTAANAWMQVPGGVRVVGGRIVDLDAVAAFRSPAWLPMALHSTLACYVAVGFGVAGVSAAALLRGHRGGYHRAALDLAMAVAAVAAVLQALSGDVVARMVARCQPIKLAAMEAHFRTARGADLILGGIPDARAGTVRWGLHLPHGLSLLAAHDPDAEVRGLLDFPADERPVVALVHASFDVMVVAGSLLMALGAVYWWVRWRRRRIGEGELPRWLLRAVALAAPLGFVALEAGWVVTEAGRQPWTVVGLLRTRDAVTPARAVGLTFGVFTALYVALAAVVVALLVALHRAPAPGAGGARGAKGEEH